MRRITIEDFHAELKNQKVNSKEDLAFKCPMCHTVQSARDLIAAGAGKTFDEVERYLAFSCVGRFTDAGLHKKKHPPGRGCDWTLGGLFGIHALEVLDEEGKTHPSFEPATPEEARKHRERFLAGSQSVWDVVKSCREEVLEYWEKERKDG